MSWSRLIKKASFGGREVDFDLLKLQKYKENVRRRARAVPLKGKRCARCGRTDNLSRHHRDYFKSKKNVRILCRKCHNIEDYEEFAKQFTQVLKSNIIQPL